MFKNRVMQLKFVDDPPPTGRVDYMNHTKDKKPTNVVEVVHVAGQYALAGVAIYMAADTLRQAIIYTVCTKVK